MPPRLPKGPPASDASADPKVRLVASVPRSLLRALRHESIDRDKSLGELIEEAFATRMRLVTNRSPQ